MAKVDTSLITAAFAEAERLNESLGDPNGMVASSMRILANDIAGRIAKDQPRFRPTLFEAQCFPLQEERKKQAILAALGTKPA